MNDFGLSGTMTDQTRDINFKTLSDTTITGMSMLNHLQAFVHYYWYSKGHMFSLSLDIKISNIYK